MTLDPLKRLVRPLADRYLPSRRPPGMPQLDHVVLLAMVPGPISDQVDRDLAKRRGALAKAGFGYVDAARLDAAVPPELWANYLATPAELETDAAQALAAVANAALPDGATKLVLTGSTMLGPEPWGPADRLQLRPSAPISLASWATLLRARRTTVVIGMLDRSTLIGELVDSLRRTGKAREADAVLERPDAAPGMRTLAERLDSALYQLVPIPVDLGEPERAAFLATLADLLGTAESLGRRLTVRERPKRTTVRAAAALRSAVGSGELLSPEEARHLGAFLSRRLRSRYDHDASAAGRSPRSSTPFLGLPAATANGQSSPLPTTQLMIYASPPPVSSMIRSHLEHHADELDDRGVVWVRLEDALTDPAARGWYVEGATGGRYDIFRRELRQAVGIDEAEDERQRSWLVTIDLGGGSMSREPGNTARSLGARAVDIIDALEPASASLLAQLVRPERIASARNQADRPADRTLLDYEGLARGVLTIPGLAARVETVDTPSPNYLAALQRFTSWVGVDVPRPESVVRIPGLGASPRAVAVAMVLEEERNKPDVDPSHIDAFLAELAPMMVDTDGGLLGESEVRRLDERHRKNLDRMFLRWLNQPVNPYRAEGLASPKDAST